MYSINSIMDMLKWDKSRKIQRKGLRLAGKVRSVNVFLQPMDSEHNKNVWENCAKVLYEKPDETLSPYLIPLLEWLQDLTWPGAIIILERLGKYGDIEKLGFALNECVMRAYVTKDKMWLMHMSELLSYDRNIKNLQLSTIKMLKSFRVDCAE